MHLFLPLLLFCIPSSVALVRCAFPTDVVSSQGRITILNINIAKSQGTRVFCGKACKNKNTFYLHSEATFASLLRLISFPEAAGCPKIPFDCKAKLTFYAPANAYETDVDTVAKCCESVGENCLENAPEFVTSTRRTKPTKRKRTTTTTPSTTTPTTTTLDPKRPNPTRLFKHDHDYDSRQQVGLLITVYSAIVAVLCGGAAIAFALEIWSYMARK